MVARLINYIRYLRWRRYRYNTGDILDRDGNVITDTYEEWEGRIKE